MNDATVQQLAQAIQALATAAAAPPAAPAAISPPPIPDHISPYEGNALDLSSRTGTSLFQKGSEALASKFTGKVEDLHLFLADLKDRSETCRWNSTTHGIISLVISGTTSNLLDDYGKVNATQIETARVACAGAGDVRAHQNAQMMYECLKNSITDDAKSALASRELNFHEDGPTLFFHIVNQLFTATFSNAQATRDKLAEFHPKYFRYNILQVNNFIRAAVKTLKAASTSGGMITDQEILYFQFKIYKKIKAPAEWTSHILFLEATVASSAGYLPDTLFNEVQSKYTNLSNQGLWRPSDKTPEEQTLAMVAQQQQNKPKGSLSPKKESTSKSPSKDKDKEKEKKGPPFAHKEGKLGDTKQWNGKTYYYCPANHKHSHWHTHKVEECNTYKKMIKQQNDNISSSSSNNNHVTMDPDKVKQGMAALFPSGDFDTDDLANALVAILEGAS